LIEIEEKNNKRLKVSEEKEKIVGQINSKVKTVKTDKAVIKAVEVVVGPRLRKKTFYEEE